MAWPYGASPPHGPPYPERCCVLPSFRSPIIQDGGYTIKRDVQIILAKKKKGGGGGAGAYHSLYNFDLDIRFSNKENNMSVYQETGLYLSCQK